jgi:WD40 repeat protein
MVSLAVSCTCPVIESDETTPFLGPTEDGDWFLKKEITVASVGMALCLAYSPAGDFLALGGEHGITILDSHTHGQVAFLDDLKWVISLSFSPNGSNLIGGSHLVLPTPGEETIRVWDTSSWTLLTTLFPTLDQLTVVSFSPDGSTVAALEMGIVHLWDTMSWEYKMEFPNGHGSNSLIFSPNGTWVATGWRDGINIFETTDWELTRHIESSLPVSPIAFSPSGASLIAVEVDGPTRMFETSSWSELGVLTLEWVRVLAFSNDDTLLATWKDNGSILLWNTSAWSLLQELTGSSWHSDLKFSPDSSQLVVASGSGEISIWARSVPAPPTPPADVDASLTGNRLENVTVRWTIPDNHDPGMEDLTGYDIYRGTTFSGIGHGYQLLDSVPSNTSEFSDSHRGAGDPNDYFYLVCAVDASNSSSCAVSQVSKFTRLLSQGPNLISLPLIQSDGSVETVLQTVAYDKAWSYNSSSQEWKWFMKAKTYRRGLWNVNHTMGIWINVTQNSNLTVAGIVPPQTTIHLHQGWNLVSFPSFNSSCTVADLKVEIGATRVEGYDPVPPHHLRILGDGDVLQAGMGYWLKVEADVTWAVEVS